MVTISDLQSITGEHVFGALLILIAILSLFTLGANAVLSFRKLRSPKTQQVLDLSDHQRACEQKFLNDYNSISSLEARVNTLEKGQRVNCAALRALLEHALHNGNANEMKAASDNLFKYLNEKE